jgi:hypothetical protein
VGYWPRQALSPMASTPTPEETARAILRILVHRLRLRRGQGTLLGTLKQQTRAEGIDPRDFPAGFQHAVDHRWLIYDAASSWVGLTEAGIAAAGDNRGGGTG